nr:RHS repeat-associated core domain-containing protein [Labedaea rhizosphaerae]
MTGWADYTEYGTPRDPAATAAVGGDRGYGWLGAKQRSTTDTFSAGLTLMGDRLYNPATGRFTSTDPEPGGSDTSYAYPTDPINAYDLNGHWWHWISSAAHAVGRGLSNAGRWAWQHKWEIATGALAVGCVFMTAGVCMACRGWATARPDYSRARHYRTS